MIFWILLMRLAGVNASFCGRSGVPFSVEVLPSGAPVLGCAQPSCLAQPADDVDDSVFNTDASGKTDGFFREGDNFHRGYLQTNKLKANCTNEFDQLACSRKNQWVGGIEYIDHPRQPLLLQCCTFEGLRFSQIVGVTPIGPGEAVTGGEVVRDGRQISFDVIADIRKVVHSADPKIISYEVAVRRMNCLPDPPEVEIAVDKNVEFELVEVLENANNGSLSLGHIGHTHMKHEKKQEKIWRREIKPGRKTRTDKREYGQAQLMERPESFGAPTFNPTSDSKQRPPYYSEFSRSEEKPRSFAMEASTATTTTVAPVFVFPAFTPYTFPTIPPPQLLLFGQFSPTRPSKVLPSSSPVSTFEFSQPIFTPPPSTSLPEHSHRLQEQASLPMQLTQPHIHQLPQENYVADNVAAHKHYSTAANNSKLYNPEAHLLIDTPPEASSRTGMPIYAPADTTQRQKKQEDLASLWQQQFFNPFSPTFMQASSAQLNKQTEIEGARGIYDPEVVEPSLPPVQQHLGVLYHPPPFPALNSALQNFQAQG